MLKRYLHMIKNRTGFFFEIVVSLRLKTADFVILSFWSLFVWTAEGACTPLSENNRWNGFVSFLNATFFLDGQYCVITGISATVRTTHMRQHSFMLFETAFWLSVSSQDGTASIVSEARWSSFHNLCLLYCNCNSVIQTTQIPSRLGFFQPIGISNISQFLTAYQRQCLWWKCTEFSHNFLPSSE